LAALLIVSSVLLSGTFSIFRYWHVRHSDFRELADPWLRRIARALTQFFFSSELGLAGFDGRRDFRQDLRYSQSWQAGHPLLMHLVGSISRGSAAFAQISPVSIGFPAILDARRLVRALIVPVVVACYGLTAGGEFLLAQQIVSAPSR